MAKSQSVAELYSRYGPVVYRRCLRLLQNRQEAEDATQHVFVQLLKNQNRLASAEDAVPWLIGVATNYCKNRYRDSERRNQRLELESTTADHGDHSALTIEDRQLALQVLQRLDEQAQHIAVGVFLEEREKQAVAAELGISDKTVQRKLKQLVESARKFLGRGEI